MKACEKRTWGLNVACWEISGHGVARRMVEGGLEGLGEARHQVGKEIIAGSEAVRKAITSRNPLTRFLVLAVLRSASFVPMLQRQFSKKILYG